ncbi:MAG: response regulator [Spirochaetales bacterium]|nr:response regulator [Spirochaetales bacterium]
MPEMNGKKLFETLRSELPHLQCLFMSGYTSNVIVHRGIVDEGVNFIQKPFSKQDLSIIIRQVLNLLPPETSK